MIQLKLNMNFIVSTYRLLPEIMEIMCKGFIQVFNFLLQDAT